jgi:hypothetical protein
MDLVYDLTAGKPFNLLTNRAYNNAHVLEKWPFSRTFAPLMRKPFWGQAGWIDQFSVPKTR